MNDLYIEQFSVAGKTKTICELSLPDTSPVPQDPLHQSLSFFRLLREEVSRHFHRAPHLAPLLARLEAALLTQQHTLTLSLLDHLEHVLDILHQQFPPTTSLEKKT